MNVFTISKSFDIQSYKDWINHRNPILNFYDDFNFVRDIDKNLLIKNTIDKLSSASEIWHSAECAFFINYLKWDTDYFGVDTFRIVGCLFGPGNPEVFMNEAKVFFAEFFAKHPHCKIFSEIPSEDFAMLQALTYSGLRLVECRLVHFKYPLEHNDQVSFRKAKLYDADNLGKVASKMRNPSDRFHADLLFENEAADRYLYTYAKACVEGYTDAVIVPDEPRVQSNSFIAINYRKADRNWNLWSPAQIVLAAVDSDMNKGWYKKLVMASINNVMDEGASCLFNTTQITNRAVIYTLESLGFRLGCTKMVLSN